MPLIKPKANNSTVGGLQIPESTKTTAADTDYFIGIDNNSLLYKISKANLLAGLSSGGANPDMPTPTVDPYFSKVVLLLHGNEAPGSNIIVNSGNASYAVNFTNVGVVNSSINSLFGGSSLRFNGSSLLNFTSSFFNVGSQDCTLETFFTFINPPYFNIIFEFRPDNTNGNYPQLAYYDEKFYIYFNAYPVVEVPKILIPGKYYYIAMKKIGNVTELWFEGIKIGSFNSGNWAGSGRLKVGENAYYAPQYGLEGDIEELRFTLGTARDVSVIPTAPFPNS